MSLPARLLDSIASAAVREGLADAVYTRLTTPIGTLLVVQGERGVVRVGFEDEPADRLLAEVAACIGPRIVASDRELAATRSAMSAYFEGDAGSLDLPVDLSLVRSAFRREALTILRDEVGPGDVVTYTGLAEKVGRPRAARAVGTACATNPVPIIVPCHRVLPRAGGVGSYAGGPDRKRRLLAHESALAAGERSTL
jgi:methylated-DNA-[protein]-cysteine S-methyltransferase